MSKSEFHFRASVTDRNLRELATVVDNLDHLKKLIDASIELKPEADPSLLSSSIADRLGLKSEDVDAIIKFGTAMLEISEQYDVPTSKIIESLSLAISEDAPEIWKKNYEKKWNKGLNKIDEFLKLLSRDNPIYISRKARKLTFRHQNVLDNMEILTDIRPVFNSKGDEILEIIVTHKMVIEYGRGRNDEIIYLAIDNEDLRLIQSACERAKVKSDAVKRNLSDYWPVKIIREVEK